MSLELSIPDLVIIILAAIFIIRLEGRINTQDVLSRVQNKNLKESADKAEKLFDCNIQEIFEQLKLINKSILSIEKNFSRMDEKFKQQ